MENNDEDCSNENHESIEDEVLIDGTIYTKYVKNSSCHNENNTKPKMNNKKPGRKVKFTQDFMCNCSESQCRTHGPMPWETTSGNYDTDLLAFENDQSWPPLEKGITIDSGAAECVIPVSCIPDVPIAESEGSKKGVHYVAAGGARIPNIGQKRVVFATPQGQVSAMTFQVADINKPLASVSKICKKGHRVVFDDDGSYIEHKSTQKRTMIRERNGV